MSCILYAYSHSVGFCVICCILSVSKFYYVQYSDELSFIDDSYILHFLLGKELGNFHCILEFPFHLGFPFHILMCVAFGISILFWISIVFWDFSSILGFPLHGKFFVIFGNIECLYICSNKTVSKFFIIIKGTVQSNCGSFWCVSLLSKGLWYILCRDLEQVCHSQPLSAIDWCLIVVQNKCLL